jgi:hypothetical protein
MSVTATATSWRAMTIAERQPLGRPATHMTQRAAFARLTPERGCSRVDRLGQCESGSEHGVEPPEPAGTGGGPGIKGRNAGLFRIPAPPAAIAGSPTRAEWAERGTFRPPGHSDGAAECGAASMATLGAADGRPSQACSCRTPWPGTAPAASRPVRSAVPFAKRASGRRRR